MLPLLQTLLLLRQAESKTQQVEEMTNYRELQSTAQLTKGEGYWRSDKTAAEEAFRALSQPPRFPPQNRRRKRISDTAAATYTGCQN